MAITPLHMLVILTARTSLETLPPVTDRLIISATANSPISAGTRCTPSHRYSLPPVNRVVPVTPSYPMVAIISPMPPVNSPRSILPVRLAATVTSARIASRKNSGGPNSSTNCWATGSTASTETVPIRPPSELAVAAAPIA